MTTKPSNPPPQAPLGQDVKLAVKDGLSELHSRLVRKTSSLAHLVESALGGAQDPVSQHHPHALLPVPFERTARFAARLIGDVDRAATELFEGDWGFRRLDFRPRPYSELLSSAGEAEAEYFTKLHYWAFRHLLGKWGRDDVRILQQGLFRAHCDAIRQLAGPQPLPDPVVAPVLAAQGNPTEAERTACTVLLALCGQSGPPVLEFDDGQDEDTRQLLTLRCAATVVVACALAEATAPGAGEAGSMEWALEIADEVVGGQLQSWLDALRSPLVTWRLATRLRTTLRHL